MSTLKIICEVLTAKILTVVRDDTLQCGMSQSDTLRYVSETHCLQSLRSSIRPLAASCSSVPQLNTQHCTLPTRCVYVVGTLLITNSNYLPTWRSQTGPSNGNRFYCDTETEFLNIILVNLGPQTVPWHRPVTALVTSVVDTVALHQIFLRVLWFSPFSMFPPTLLTHFHFNAFS